LRITNRVVVKKNFLAFFIFPFFTNAQDTVPPAAPPVSSSCNMVQGTVTYTNRYCGGARPGEEILAEYATPKNFVSTTIYLKRKKGGKVIYKIVTDKDGKFKKCIKPGKYFLYMSIYYNKKLPLNFNPKCTMSWTSYGEVEILDHAKKLYLLNLHFDCDPCSPPRP
jgi:hypothetical protein